MQKKAVISGATGLVGKELLNHLIEEDYYEKIYILSRRPLTYSNPKLEVIVINYDDTQSYKDKFSAHHYYCCLGTTIKQAKSLYNFYRVDYLYVYRLASLAEKDSNCSQFILLTSVGAKPSSSIFYNRVKGQVEHEVAKLSIKGIHFLRPSILLGHRTKKRTYEEVGKICFAIIRFFLIGSYAAFLAIQARKVAIAMFRIAKSETEGTNIYSPNKMIQISHKKD